MTDHPEFQADPSTENSASAASEKCRSALGRYAERLQSQLAGISGRFTAAAGRLRNPATDVTSLSESNGVVSPTQGGTSLSEAKGMVSPPTTPFVPQGVPAKSLRGYVTDSSFPIRAPTARRPVSPERSRPGFRQTWLHGSAQVQKQFGRTAAAMRSASLDGVQGALAQDRAGASDGPPLGSPITSCGAGVPPAQNAAETAAPQDVLLGPLSGPPSMGSAPCQPGSGGSESGGSPSSGCLSAGAASSDGAGEKAARLAEQNVQETKAVGQALREMLQWWKAHEKQLCSPPRPARAG